MRAFMVPGGAEFPVCIQGMHMMCQRLCLRWQICWGRRVQLCSGGHLRVAPQPPTLQPHSWKCCMRCCFCCRHPRHVPCAKVHCMMVMWLSMNNTQAPQKALTEHHLRGKGYRVWRSRHMSNIPSRAEQRVRKEDCQAAYQS